MEDVVNNPKHYNHGKIECVDVIEDWKLGYHLGNCIKYICRCEHKGKKFEDLKKAKWYLDRYIQILECSEKSKENTNCCFEAPPFPEPTMDAKLKKINKKLSNPKCHLHNILKK